MHKHWHGCSRSCSERPAKPRRLLLSRILWDADGSTPDAPRLFVFKAGMDMQLRESRTSVRCAGNLGTSEL
jgi:hypothetical protein